MLSNFVHNDDRQPAKKKQQQKANQDPPKTLSTLPPRFWSLLNWKNLAHVMLTDQGSRSIARNELTHRFTESFGSFFLVMHECIKHAKNIRKQSAKLEQALASNGFEIEENDNEDNETNEVWASIQDLEPYWNYSITFNYKHYSRVSNNDKSENTEKTLRMLLSQSVTSTDQIWSISLVPNSETPIPQLFLTIPKKRQRSHHSKQPRKAHSIPTFNLIKQAVWNDMTKGQWNSNNILRVRSFYKALLVYDEICSKLQQTYNEQRSIKFSDSRKLFKILVTSTLSHPNQMFPRNGYSYTFDYDLYSGLYFDSKKLHSQSLSHIQEKFPRLAQNALSQHKPLKTAPVLPPLVEELLNKENRNLGLSKDHRTIKRYILTKARVDDDMRQLLYHENVNHPSVYQHHLVIKHGSDLELDLKYPPSTTILKHMGISRPDLQHVYNAYQKQ